MSNIFFTSDTHFGHANIIKYSKRPFQSIEHQDEELIERWNARVKPGDTVYHLGDFAFMPHISILATLARLNGQKHLLRGNHDKELDKASRYFNNSGYKTNVAFYGDYKEIKVGEQKIILFHYPLLTWNKSHYGSFHLHGHEHGSLPDNPNARRIDVGVDSVGTWLAPHYEYSPISFDEVRIVMDGKNWKPVEGSHHTGMRM